VGSSDGKCRLWSVDGWKLLREIQIDNHKDVTNTVSCLTFFPCGKKLVVGDDEGIVKVVDVETGKLLTSLRTLRRTTWTVAVSPDGKYVGSSDLHRLFHVWDAEKEQSIATVRLPFAYPSITFGKDEAFIAEGTGFRIFDVKTKKLTNPRELQ
jgi:WD40 repeat protein